MPTYRTFGTFGGEGESRHDMPTYRTGDMAKYRTEEAGEQGGGQQRGCAATEVERGERWGLTGMSEKFQFAFDGLDIGLLPCRGEGGGKEVAVDAPTATKGYVDVYASHVVISSCQSTIFPLPCG
mgnify:CR=1 FL=1